MIPHCLPEQIHLVNLGDKALLSTYLDSSPISTHLHFSAQFSLHTVPFTRMYYPHLSLHLTSSQLLHFGWSPSTPESITWLPWWPSSDSQLKIMLHDVCFRLWSTQSHPAPWEPVGKKMVPMILHAGQQRRYGHKHRLLASVGEGEGEMICENSIKTYTLPYAKQIKRARLMYDAGHPKPVLCDILEG